MHPEPLQTGQDRRQLVPAPEGQANLFDGRDLEIGLGLEGVAHGRKQWRMLQGQTPESPPTFNRSSNIRTLPFASNPMRARSFPALAAHYINQVMATAGKDLDASGRAMLEEDLRSPCTEEIAVFRAFARIVAQGRKRFVVLDTAPTGHTLLLLDATEAYHREVARKASDMPEEVLNLLPRLRDASFTHVLIVTLPEATPVHEAAALQADLRRAQIEPFAWVINQSFVEAQTSDPLLRARGAAELPFIREVTEQHSSRTALVPWVPEEPVGAERLQQLFHEPELIDSKD